MASIEEYIESRPGQLDMDAIFGRPIGISTPQNADRVQRRVIYWRKADHEGATDAGWITTGPEMITDTPGYQRFLTKRWFPLEKFGNQISGQKYKSSIIWGATPAQRQKPETWLETFFQNGGLTYVIAPNDPYGKPGTWLIPATQLVSMGLHLNEEVRRVRPDLNSAIVKECPHRCINENGSLRIFSGITDAQAQTALDQHMATKHTLSEGTRAVGDVVEKLINDRGAVDATQIAAIVAAVTQALGVTKEEEKKPTGPRYPDGFPDETWRRQELMAYAKDRNLGHPRDSHQEALKAATEEWFDHVIKMIHTSPDPDTPVDTESVFGE